MLRRQHGVIALDQAETCGMTRTMVATCVRHRRWEPVLRGVYRDAAAPRSWQQQVMAACLAGGLGGTCASGPTAGRLLGLDGCDHASIEVTTTGSWRGAGKVKVRHRRTLRAADVTTVNHIPCTTAGRTLLDVGASLPEQEVEKALECALRRRLTSANEMRWRAKTAPRNDRGAAILRSILRGRDEQVATESILETEFLQALRNEGLPPPTRQFRIFENGRCLMRADFAYPEARLAIELDGFRWHGGRERWERDHRKRSRLPALGWRLIVVTKRQLQTERAEVVANVARAAGVRLI